jgi:hypothetical protein
MKKTLMSLSAALAFFAALVVSAGSARADSDGFVAELQSDGVPILGLSGPGRYIEAGYTICMELHSGASPDTAADSSGFGQLYAWKQQLVTAAQHNLCPDTLRR